MECYKRKKLLPLSQVTRPAAAQHGKYKGVVYHRRHLVVQQATVQTTYIRQKRYSEQEYDRKTIEIPLSLYRWRNAAMSETQETLQWSIR